VQRAERSGSLHTDVTMARDFQDLTGRVCLKIEAITEKIENQLLRLLIETAPKDQWARHQEMLEGPQLVTGRADNVTSQSEVDELLGSLGF
jgi:chemotaxis protein CheZ